MVDLCLEATQTTGPVLLSAKEKSMNDEKEIVNDEKRGFLIDVTPGFIYMSLVILVAIFTGCLLRGR